MASQFIASLIYPSPKRAARQQERKLHKTEREITNMRKRVETKKVQAVEKVRVAARRGDPVSVNSTAQQVVQLNREERKLLRQEGDIASMGFQVMGLAANATIMDAIKQNTYAMKIGSRSINVDGVRKIQQQFEYESEVLNIKKEMLEDVVQDALVPEEVSDETQELTDQVLDEIGIEISQIPNPGSARPAGSVVIRREEGADTIDELAARLQQLKAPK